MLNNTDSTLQLTASQHSLRRSASSPRELPNSNACCFLTLSWVCYMSFLGESHSVPNKGYYWPHFTEEQPLKPLSHLLMFTASSLARQGRTRYLSPDCILECRCNHSTPFIWTYWSPEVYWQRIKLRIPTLTPVDKDVGACRVEI